MRGIVLVAALMTPLSVFAQPGGAQPPAAGDLQAAIDALGSFDFVARTDAARTVRRAPAAQVVGPLQAAAREHKDEYVRYRALVLLSGIDQQAAGEVMREVIGDRNDRLRTVAFEWFAYHPDPAVLPRLIAALPAEQSEFVRPALTRALAAHGTDPRVREVLVPLVSRGQDSFRGAVIEALGDFEGRYALPAIVEVAKLEGPLQDDAVTAIGKLGDGTMRATLADLRSSAPEEVQPTLAASLCLIGVECEAQEKYLRETLAFATATDGYQPLLRGVVHALGVLAVRGREDALGLLFDAGVKAADPTRAPIALGVGLVALRNPEIMLRVLAARPDVDAAVELVGEAIEMLTEDFEEERLYVELRRRYWAASDGSPERSATGKLIERLEF